jgi:hypothetical protein
VSRLRPQVTPKWTLLHDQLGGAWQRVGSLPRARCRPERPLGCRWRVGSLSCRVEWHVSEGTGCLLGLWLICCCFRGRGLGLVRFIHSQGRLEIAVQEPAAGDSRDSGGECQIFKGTRRYNHPGGLVVWRFTRRIIP